MKAHQAIANALSDWKRSGSTSRPRRSTSRTTARRSGRLGVGLRLRARTVAALRRDCAARLGGVPLRECPHLGVLDVLDGLTCPCTHRTSSPATASAGLPEERPAPAVAVGAGSQTSAAPASDWPPSGAAEPDVARWHQLLRDPAVPLTTAMAARPPHLHLSP